MHMYTYIYTYLFIYLSIYLSGKSYPRQNSQSFCNLISPSVLYSWKVSPEVQRTLQRRGLHTGVNARRWGSLGAILESAYHLVFFKYFLLLTELFWITYYLIPFLLHYKLFLYDTVTEEGWGRCQGGSCAWTDCFLEGFPSSTNGNTHLNASSFL